MGLKKLDWVMIVPALLLTGLGLLSIYSSSLGRGDFSNFQKQLVFTGIGFIFTFLISGLDWRILKNNPYLILVLYGIGILGLVGLFFFAPEIRGTKGWYRLGGISVDPIEYMKLILVILMAKYFSTRHIEMYRIRHILLSAVYFILPIILISFQPNLGSALVLLILWVATLLVSGIKMRHFLFLLLIGIFLAIFSWNFFLQDYQKARILTFLEPEIDPLGMGWNQLQAKIAIGNGGIFGQGIGKGTQTQHFFLPEPQTDFIFSAIGEELGFIGILALFLLYFALIWRILKVGIEAQSNFPRLFATGFATLIIAELFLNIGMNLGLLPIVGLPLPLVSYGGSSLIFTYIGLGMLQSIKTH